LLLSFELLFLSFLFSMLKAVSPWCCAVVISALLLLLFKFQVAVGSVCVTHTDRAAAPLGAGERPGIVVLTIGLEESLPKLPGAVIPSKLWSPYRLPLVRFLNQYPTER
jgi:hypothetical protein